jgi:XTP/dITP diphosphohydrolase
VETVLLATRNAGKIRELGAMLAPYGVKVVGLDAHPDVPEVEETGATFAENALLKARHAAARTGLPSVADDSGLEVDILKGAPGVYSARFSDDWTSLPGESRDARNIRKLLHVMEGHREPESRACRFVCAIAAVRPDDGSLEVSGRWEGRVLDVPRGTNGFGYDPVFLDPELGRTAAELSQEEKNARSHRGKALRGLMSRWETFARGSSLGG